MKAMIGVLLAIAQPLLGQQPGAHVRDRVPPDVAAAVEEIVTRAQERGLPTEPLILKAIEGGAKGVPADHVVGAVRTLALRLETAAHVLRASGITHASARTIEAGSFALSTGFNRAQLATLARAVRAPYPPEQTLRTAGALTVLGVPPRETVEVLVGMIAADRPAADLIELPVRVQAAVARGMPAAEAARGAGRGGPALGPGGPRPPPNVPPKGPPADVPRPPRGRP